MMMNNNDYYFNDNNNNNNNNPCSIITTTTSSTSTCRSALSYSVYLTPTTKQRSSSSSSSRAPSKFKGVVPQPNGRWGAQLYNGNKRVWIGTFDTQQQAAHAYDVAIIRFRGPQAITNFPIRHYGRSDLEFLACQTQVRVIGMLRNHTYQDELARFKRARLGMSNLNHDPKMTSQSGLDLECSHRSREMLFKKVMTPSDVGRLHRLVIPKHLAESYLPKITHKKNNKEKEEEEVMLNFEDSKNDRIWKFKYCYWNSSQNYVLTKGWGEFVKEKGLKAGDSVLFYSILVGSDETRRLSIDISYKQQEEVVVIENKDCDNNNGIDIFAVGTASGTATATGEVALSTSKVTTTLRLFGVDVYML